MEMSAIISWAGTAKGTSGSGHSATDPLALFVAGSCGQSHLTAPVCDKELGTGTALVAPLTFQHRQPRNEMRRTSLQL